MCRSISRALARAAVLLLTCFAVAVHAAGPGPEGGRPEGAVIRYKNVPTFITTHELIEPDTDFLGDSTPLISNAGALSS